MDSGAVGYATRPRSCDAAQAGSKGVYINLDGGVAIGRLHAETAIFEQSVCPQLIAYAAYHGSAQTKWVLMGKARAFA